ncbi:hypothetical protein J4E91_010280 [Alternaria rosae]|nr:hypothetical protein J4E91_010280 [Alternaria rosae]
MPYLVQPPAQSIEACDPLFTYALGDPIPSEISILKDLQNWGWEVSVHFHDDATYLNATKEVEKAIKTRRRRTQMIHGDMVGDSPRLTLEELLQRETTKRLEQELYKIREKEEINDAASIMSPMTEQRAWVRWADKEAGLEVESPNGLLAASIQACMFATYSALLKKTYPTGMYLCHITLSNALVTSHSPKEADLLMDPHTLAMTTCGYWCPPVFPQAWSQKNPQSQSDTPSAVLSSRDSKEPRKLQKRVFRHNSEPSGRNYLPLRFVRPLSWVKEKRNGNEEGSADATTSDQQQIEAFDDARNAVNTVSRRSTPPPLEITPATTQSDSFLGPYQSTAPTQSDPNLYLQEHSATFLQPKPCNISPAFSTTSSLIFPSCDITPKEYFQRTNRPQKNLQPRQLTPPPVLVPEKDPYMWQAWDRGRTRQQDKTDRVLGKHSMHRPDSGNGSWYDSFQKMMKEEQAKMTKEEKKADKETRKAREKEEKEERIRKENAAREALMKQGMFAAGYLPMYA